MSPAAPPPSHLAGALAWARGRLAGCSSSPDLDAQVLLAELLVRAHASGHELPPVPAADHGH